MSTLISITCNTTHEATGCMYINEEMIDGTTGKKKKKKINHQIAVVFDLMP